MAAPDILTNADKFSSVAVFTNQAITDTNPHNSLSADVRGYKSKTVTIASTLNQTASVQIQVSNDGVAFGNVGSAQSVTAGATVAVDDSVVAMLAKPYGYIRLVATCAVAPASGNLNATVGMAFN